MYKFVNYKMKEEEVIQHIINWMTDYQKRSNTNGFVIGVSGGIDSALTSTLAARSGITTLCVEMPIHQNKLQVKRGENHIKWLKNNFNNISSIEHNLTDIFDSFEKSIPNKTEENELALVNTRARIRMTCLYYHAQVNNYLVLGTGNKVEDFGIGFFTKYGDGGVDISPIADLLKTEVYKLAKYLGINQDILKTPPTDGLWGEDKTDEDQIGATYPELEWAMNFNENEKLITERDKEVLNIFRKLNLQNQHKMNEIPVCKIPKLLK